MSFYLHKSTSKSRNIIIKRKASLNLILPLFSITKTPNRFHAIKGKTSVQMYRIDNSKIGVDSKNREKVFD